ncbi:MAG: hypothetical protein VYB17_02420 [Candidatus Thermoplasmatota archaeon]|nr:hypothetical protein [Candidatus Thermoplasmatota archaeon]
MSANKWPKRLALTGAIMLALSTAVMWSSYDEMIVILDPGQNHLLELEEGQTEDVNLSNTTSYLLFRLNNAPVDCQIIENHTGTEVSIGNPSLFQTDRDGENGRYYAVGTFIPDAGGMHSIENTANTSDGTLWVVDEYDLGEDANSIYLFQGGCYGLLCGGCLLPIALFIWYSGRKKSQQAGLVMQAHDGRMVPIAPTDGTMQQRIPTTDEVWRSVHGGEVIDLTVQQGPPPEDEIPAPFADRPDRTGELTKVVDEIESVDDSMPVSSENDGETTERSWKTWDEG